MYERQDPTRRAATPLPVEFFLQDAATVARALLGAWLVADVGGAQLTGRIVETEAYLGEGDPASHAWRGRRHAQNVGVYSSPGCWYVYRSYGIHWCANLCVAGPARGSAVLLRAVQPHEGLEIMRTRRPKSRTDRTLASGPGRLAEAYAMTRDLDGVAMASAPVCVLPGASLGPIHEGPRIGITRAADWPLRFVSGDATWWSRPMPDR